MNLVYTATSDTPQTGTMTVSSASGALATVALGGSGQDAAFIQASPLSLSFGDVDAGTISAAQVVTFTNLGNATAPFGLGISPAGPFSAESNCPTSLQPGQSCQASVTFSPLSTGNFKTSLFEDEGGLGNYYVSLSGQGITTASGGAGALVLSLTAANFGIELVGVASAGQTIGIWNTGVVPVTLNSDSWTLTSSQGSSSDFYVTASNCGNMPIQILPQGYCYLSVGFTPSAAGTETATFSINDTTSASPHTVSLTGLGVAATQTLEFEPGNMTYPDQPVGIQSAAQTFYVYSTGTAPVTMDRVLVNGDFQITRQICSGQTLTGTTQPGLQNGYCYVSVAFTPTTTGLRTGTLTIIDSATGNPQVLNLAGNGVTPVAGPPAVNPTALVFPAQVVGTTSSLQYVTITNPGNVAFTLNSLATGSNFAVDYYTCSTPYTIAPAGACTFGIEFTPTTSTGNPLTGTLTAETTAGNQTVSLSGTSVAASQAIGFTPSSVAFGGVVSGTTSYTYPIYVRNTGTESVTFKSAPSIAAPFAVVYDACTPAGSLAPATSCEIDLTYTPTATSQQTGSMSLSTSAGTEKLNLAGTGAANIPTASLSPGAMAFTQQLINTASNQQLITLTYNGTSHLNVNSVSISSGSANFVIETGSDACTGHQLTQNGACSVYLTFAPTVAGYDTGVVTFATSSGSYTAALSGYSPAGSDIAYLSPANLAFSPQVVSTSSSGQTIYFYNTSNGTITLGSLNGTDFGSGGEYSTTATGGYDGCSGISLGAGGACYADVVFTPAATGGRNGTLVFPITYGDGTTGSATAALTGSGIAQINRAIVTPSLLNFSDQVVGTTSAYQIMTLTNSGNVAFTVGSVSGSDYGSGSIFSVYANNAAYDSCSGEVVQPTASCSVFVVFTPPSSGAQTGTLVFPVTYNGATSATPIAATLTGTGVAAGNQPVLSPTAMNFSTQEVGTISGYSTITLSNSGNLPWNVGTLTGSNYGSGKVFHVYASGYDGCSGVTVPPNSTCTVFVVFAPANAASYSGTLVFPVTYSGATSPVDFTATLSGTGLAASSGLAFSQTTVLFGSQPVGTSSQPAPVLLINQTPNPITVNTITLGGSNPTAFQENDDCAGTSIPGNSYCTINVTFAPSSTQSGMRGATVKETDTGTGSGRSITLTGTGSSDLPMVVFYPASLTFSAQQPLGEGTAPQNVTVTNIGVDNLKISAVASSDAMEFPVVADGCTGKTLAQGASCILSMVFAPTSAGAHTATISVTDNATGSPQALSVSGGGSAKLATTVTLTAPATAVEGSLVTLSASVVDQNSNPLTNGSVTFLDGSKALGTAEVVRTNSGGGTIGTATLKTLTLPLGANSVTAEYTGAEAAGTSAASTVTMTGSYPSTTTFASTGSAGDYTFTGTVSGAWPILPTGNVAFKDQTTGLTLGTAPVSASTVVQSFVSVPDAATYTNPIAETEADLNGDGKPDLIFFDSVVGLQVQIGNGDGTFQAPIPISTSFGVTRGGFATGDFNGDGRMDLASATGGAVAVMLGNGDGTFQDVASYDPGNFQQIAVGDFNGDGVLDIVGAMENNGYLPDGAIELLLGNGDGEFQEPIHILLPNGASPTSIAVGDINGDGKLDVIAGTVSGGLYVLLGNGNGTFQTPQPLTTPEPVTQVLLADLRGNGKLDIVTVGSNFVGILLGNGDGTFGANTSALSGCDCDNAVGVADVNGDGKPDLLVAQGTEGAAGDVDVLLGAGDGTFGTGSTYPTGAYPYVLLAADLNNDGRPDIVTANYGSTNATVLVNQVTQTATFSSATVPGTSSAQHSVTAGYVGDTNFGASTSSALLLAPTPVTPSMQLAGIPSATAVYATPLSVLVTMSGPLAFVPAPSGTVSYAIDGGAPQPATLANGTVSIPVTGLTAGSHTVAVTYNGDQFYVTAMQTLGLTITKATPVITWTTPAAITYGTALSSVQLDATANVPGQFVYTPGTSAVLSAGTQTLNAAFTPTDTTDYFNANGSVMLTVNPAPLTVTGISQSRQYGSANPSLSATVTGLVNGDTIGGDLTLTCTTTATITSPVAAYPITCIVSGPAAPNYTVTSNAGTLTLTKAPLTVTVQPATRTYGSANPAFTSIITGLLNGDTVTVTYNTTANASSTVGIYQVTATVSGTTSHNYQSKIDSSTLTITPKTPAISWATPAPITYGTALSGTQLDATTAGAQGSFSYSPGAGTVLPAGTQTLTATFTPTDTTDYNQATKTVILTVNKAKPVISWTAPAAIPYGTALSGTQLNATANVDGTPTYSPAAGTVLGAGTRTLSVTFTPTDVTDYATVTAKVSITVTKAPLTVQVANATRLYGSANPAFTSTVTGLLNGDSVTLTYSTPATPASAVGTYAISATVSGPAAANYTTTVDKGALTVSKATLTVTADPQTMVYGSALPSFTATITGFLNGDPQTVVTGAPTFTTGAGPKSTVGTYHITPALGTLAAKNYKFAFATGPLTITPAPLTIVVNNASRVVGSANPAFSGTVSGLLNGNTVTVTYSTTATKSSPVGTYPITAAISGAYSVDYTAQVTPGTLTVTASSAEKSQSTP